MLRTHKNIFSTLKRKADFKKEQKAHEILRQCLKNQDLHINNEVIPKLKDKSNEVNGFLFILRGIDKNKDKARIKRYLYRSSTAYPYSEYPVSFRDKDNVEIIDITNSSEKIFANIKEMLDINPYGKSQETRRNSSFLSFCIFLKRHLLERKALRYEKLQGKQAINIIRQKCIEMLADEYTLEKLDLARDEAQESIKDKLRRPIFFRLVTVTSLSIIFILILSLSQFSRIYKSITNDIILFLFSLFSSLKDKSITEILLFLLSSFYLFSKLFEDWTMFNTCPEEDHLSLIQEAIKLKNYKSNF